MQLNMQERDALLAGLLLLRIELAAGRVVVNTADPESCQIGDMYSNGGAHTGLSVQGALDLADMLVAAFPSPPIGQVSGQSTLDATHSQPKFAQ